MTRLGAPSTKSALLIIGGYSPESHSPTGKRARYMALAASSFFSKTILLTPGRTKDQRKKSVGSKVLLYTLGFVNATPYPISALFDPIKLLAFFIYGIRLSMRYKPSFIIAEMPPLETGASAWLLTRLLRKKLIIDCGDDWESALRTQLIRYIPLELMKPAFKFTNKIYSFANIILVISPTLVNTLRRRGINVSMILVPDGADTSTCFPQDEESRREIRLRYALPLNKIVVTYCGSSGNPYYRLDLILQAAKSLPNKVKDEFLFVFFLYGTRARIEGYNKLKDRLKIPDDLVEIRGPLPRKNLFEVMTACDVGLVPFDDKPFLLYARSAKVYEYLTAGLYVIGSGPKRGELDSFLSQNTNCGIFIRPRVDDFVRVFLNVVENAEGLFENNCRKLRHSFVKESYDTKKIMARAMARLSSVKRVLT